MQITGSKIQYLPTTIMIVVGVLVWVLMASDVIADYHNAIYTQSAHGDSISGVNRKGLSSFHYAVGNCAHCHEQHASIDGEEPSPVTGEPGKFLLFAKNFPRSQTNNFCFRCHRPSSDQVGGVTNNDYGWTFGGGRQRDVHSASIKEAFNFGLPNQAYTTGSSHNLRYIRDWSKNQTWGGWITNNTNACVVCHDPHYAQKNHDPYAASPPYKTAIRRPKAPYNRPRNLWGDETDSDAGNEMMSEYTSLYQAPYYVSVSHDPNTGPFEPAGVGTKNGSNLPNFTRFCLNCHSNPISPSDIYDLEAIDWSQATGDQHGRDHTTHDAGSTLEPYDPAWGWVLNCTDCHEPHGSPNEWLLRTCVNGKDNINIPNPGRWWHFCTACHVLTEGTETVHQEGGNPLNPAQSCSGCHSHNRLF